MPSAYVHVPFCRRRCGYCNFTVVAGHDELIEPFLRALQLELSWLETPRPVETLFLGGGTPTQLPLRALERLLQLVTRWFVLARGAEFSVEANPADVQTQRMQLLADAGVNRLSLGVQSFDADKLRVLERDHRAADIHRAIDLARQHIPNLAVDLIFAVPGETPAVWQQDLEQTQQLQPQHVSAYGLTYERGARFWSLLSRGLLRPAAEEDERWMYETAIDQLTDAGFEHYEISNFARSGYRCRHNEVYWTGGEYYAVGPGASRHLQGCRETNHRSTSTYLKRVLAGESPVAESEQLAPEDRARERLVFGLRRLEGVDLDRFEHDTGFAAKHLLGDALVHYQQLGLLTMEENHLKLSRSGLLVSDALWPAFLFR